MRVPRIWLIVGLVGLIALWFGIPATLHAQAPTSLDEYHNAVVESLTLMQKAQAFAPVDRPPLQRAAADRLEQIGQVQTPSGALVRVNNTELVALIRDPDQIENAIARLSALESALERPLPTINPNYLATLRGILSRPPFVQETTQTWWQTLLQQFLDFLDRLFSNTAQGVFDVRDLFILAAVVVVIGVLVYLIRNLRRSLVSESSLPPEMLAEEARTPGEAFDNAQRYVNAGDYRSAVPQLYLATLLLLDQRGRIKYDPTLTNREYLRQTKNDARTTAALQPIVETFDRTWYGFEPISAQDFDEYRQRVEGIKTL